MMKRRLGALLAVLGGILVPAGEGLAATIVIGNGAGRIVLRIGTAGGTINVVSFTVPAANIGDGVALTSTAVTPASGTCPANTVLVDLQARSTAGLPRTATLSVNSSAPLTSGGFNIPFTQVAWTSSTPGGSACLAAPVTIPSGTFTGAAGQNLISIATSRRACVCKQFRYLNQNAVSAGSYTGRVTYTATMP